LGGAPPFPGNTVDYFDGAPTTSSTVMSSRYELSHHSSCNQDKIAVRVRARLQIGACFGRALSEVEFIDGLHHMELHHRPFSISPPDFLSKI